MFQSRIALLTSAAALLLAASAATPASAQIVTLKPPPITQYGPPDLVPQITANKSSILAGNWATGVYETVLFTVTVENRTTVVASNPITGAKQIAGSAASGVSLEIDLGPNLRQAGNIGANGGLSCLPASSQVIQCVGGTIGAGGSATVVIEAYAARIYAPCWEVNYADVGVDPNNTIAEVSELNNRATSSVLVTSIC